MIDCPWVVIANPFPDEEHNWVSWSQEWDDNLSLPSEEERFNCVCIDPRDNRCEIIASGIIKKVLKPDRDPYFVRCFGRQSSLAHFLGEVEFLKIPIEINNLKQRKMIKSNLSAKRRIFPSKYLLDPTMERIEAYHRKMDALYKEQVWK